MADDDQSIDRPPRDAWSVAVVPRAVAVDDVDALLDDVAGRVAATVGDGERGVAQAVDARYVVSERHLEEAFAKALRATRRGEAVADGLAMETLLYAAGTRQIDVATDIGPSGDTAVVAVVAATTADGGASALRGALEGLGDAPETFPCADEQAVRAFYDVGDQELSAVSGDAPDGGDDGGDSGAGERATALERLVRERVALLDVRK